jgi:arylsulfatase A-like enzyme
LAAESRPNVLLIYVDDLGYHDLGCQGATDLDTPNIDRLAASGVRFTSGYVTAPQCGPSRAGLLTGMNQARFGYHDNGKNNGLPPASKVPTIAEYMKKSGYPRRLLEGDSQR